MSTVIERIRKALHIPQGGLSEDTRANVVFAKGAGWAAPAGDVPAGDLPGLIAQIRTEAGHLNLQVHECASAEQCGAELAALVEGRRPEWGTARQVMCWSDPVIQGLGLEARLAGTDISVRTVPERERFDETERAEFRRQVVDSYMGVTTADLLVADTATLLLLGGRGRGRSVSLVPSIHVAVVPVGRIVRTFRDALRRLDARGLGLPSNMTFITGPSKTADIEATLVHGAHGPREMHLFLLP